MGISFSETQQVFHVPYGPPNHDGIPQASFIDCKAHPEWIPILPACVGCPEMKDFLQFLNSPYSAFMSLAAFQQMITTGRSEFPLAMTSMVGLCYAETPNNSKTTMVSLAHYLQTELSEAMQDLSNVLQQPVFMEILLELQPTIFHDRGMAGWSLAALFVCNGTTYHEARSMWRGGMVAFQRVLHAAPSNPQG